MPNTFKDQFAPFRHFGCDFKDEYKGTLFRFPLRTASLARKSEISKKSYTVSDIQKNLSDLVDQLANHLIFLRSVKCIDIYTCKKGQSPILLHHATSTVFSREGRYDQSLLQYFDKSNTLPRDLFYQKLLSTPDDMLPTQSFVLKVIVDTYQVPNMKLSKIDVGESVLINDSTDRCGEILALEGLKDGEEANQKLHVDEKETSQNEEGSLIMGGREDMKPVSQSLPLSPPLSLSLSTPLLESSEIVEYLVVNGLMGGEAKRVACDEKSRHLKLIPLGAVAACISRVGSISMESDPRSTPSRSCFPPMTGRVFCFLPLPVTSQLPVHCNAYWELSANRRDIWR